MGGWGGWKPGSRETDGCPDTFTKDSLPRFCGADSAHSQCPLSLPPVCGIALGTSGVRALPSHTENQGHTAPAGTEYMTTEPQQVITHGAGTHVTAHTKNRMLAQGKWYHVPHTETQPATWGLIFIFNVGNPKILRLLEGARTGGLGSDVPCFQGTAQAKQWNGTSQLCDTSLSSSTTDGGVPPGTPILPEEGQQHTSWEALEGAHCLYFPERRTQSPFCLGWN